MIDKPTVTIIMATYNRAKFIEESLIAIQNQTYKSWECLIIDDDGTDDTDIVIAPILENDKRFQYLKRNDQYQKGLPGCRNYGLNLAQGEYIIFFDDDDIAHPQNLEICVSEFKKSDISFCRYIREVFYSSDFCYSFDYSKKYTSFNIDINDLEKMLNNSLQFNSCAVMWKRECFDQNKYVEELMYAEEWELYTRIISSGFKGVSINKCLFYGRKHENSNTGEFNKKSPIRRASYAKAALLVLKNLKEKKLLTRSIVKYFVILSYCYKEYNLFKSCMNLIELSKMEKHYWKLFYTILPLRILMYKIVIHQIKKIR